MTTLKRKMLSLLWNDNFTKIAIKV